MSNIGARACRGLGAVLVCFLSVPLQGQVSTAGVVRTLRGRVVNAVDGSGVPRALVTVNARSVMTDSQGRYELVGYTDTSATVTLLKPGFTSSADASPMSGRLRLTDLDADAVLKLYPNATITGTVTGRDGLAVAGANVMLQRLTYEPGGPRWQVARSVRTNRQGEFRFREAAGRFQVSQSFMAGDRNTGEDVLPVTFPANSSRSPTAYFDVAPGEERHIDLRPRTGNTYSVALRVDTDLTERGLQWTVTTSTGDTFAAPAQSSGPSNGWLLSLPIGSYTVTARVTGDRDTMLIGSARVSITGTRSDPVVVHVEPVSSLPIEVVIDPFNTLAPSSTSGPGPGNGTNPVAEPNQAPDPRQWSLHLHNVSSTSEMGQDVFIRQREDKSYEFRAPPGRYRLLASAVGGGWYVQSASYGVANLMTTEIVVASGAVQAPVRIVASNAFGTVKGTVRFPADGTDVIWVYFVPQVPGIGMINPVGVGPGTGSTGQFSMRLPAGSYYAVAYRGWIHGDVHDADVLSRLAAQAKTVEISASGVATTVDLDVSQEKDETK